MLGNTSLEINKNIAVRFKLDGADLKIWIALQTFFINKKNWEVLLSFLKSDSKISLRVIDYFLTTYCFNNKIEYYNKNIFSEYKKQLKNYHKKYFDPCSRGTKIPFFYNKNICVITTICQLNFFKWFIETNYYIKFIEEYQIIKTSMKNMKNTTKIKKTFSFHKNNVIYCSTEKNIKVKFD
ncbi:hypothetical protein crov373 [Cafeteria roenbergensis virus]|uniref:Uncharacterized protein n=1 Tax=Cafeteria roenbergensis virus (strain BV-PW1) TaxID=693272 RepID=E3T5E4_CROVB|nr:hypothetical protein crov373 [Cafeteria roenbergensis virus BV-PW1]ADO67407.1 hypothetical protein crov373 [Cafeteria roenbergensis virus BV-PW1]